MVGQANEPGFDVPHDATPDMASPGPAAVLPNWDRLSQGVAFALTIHAAQTRKGTDTPYISHLLAVAGIVLEHGGDEDQAIAALLHDAVEDQGAHQEPVIAARFGPRVARIVRGCTDADTLPKPPWHARKQAYLDHLAEAGPDVLLVSAADKLHNARAICADLKQHGAAVFDRFKGGQDGTLWYYIELVQRFRWLMPGPLTSELAAAVGAMCLLANEPAALEPAPEMLGHTTPAPWRELFAARLGQVCAEMAPDRQSGIVEQIIASARQRKPFGLVDGSGSLWDEYASMLAADAGFGMEEMEDAMRAVCNATLDGLPLFEQRLLARTTEEYWTYWDVDAPEPGDADARRWLVQELLATISIKAFDHGYELAETEAGEEEAESG